MYLTVACPDCSQPMRLHAAHDDTGPRTVHVEVRFDRDQLTHDLAAHLRHGEGPHPTFHGDTDNDRDPGARVSNYRAGAPAPRG